MKLTYIYHSCFALETPAYSILFDYYKDTKGKQEARLCTRHLAPKAGTSLYLVVTFSSGSLQPGNLFLERTKGEYSLLIK